MARRMPGGPCVDEASFAHSIDVPATFDRFGHWCTHAPEQIEELLQSTKQQKVADIIPDESENGDGTIRSDT